MSSLYYNPFIDPNIVNVIKTFVVKQIQCPAYKYNVQDRCLDYNDAMDRSRMRSVCKTWYKCIEPWVIEPSILRLCIEPHQYVMMDRGDRCHVTKHMPPLVFLKRVCILTVTGMSPWKQIIDIPKAVLSIVPDSVTPNLQIVEFKCAPITEEWRKLASIKMSDTIICFTCTENGQTAYNLKLYRGQQIWTCDFASGTGSRTVHRYGDPFSIGTGSRTVHISDDRVRNILIDYLATRYLML